MSDHEEAVRPDWFGLVAKERGVPDGWRWYSSTAHGNAGSTVFLVTGAVVGGLFAKGKNAGKPNPAKYTDKRELVITRADLDAVKAKWSAETGKCSACYGEGRVSTGWSKETGRTYRACRACTTPTPPRQTKETL